MELSEMIISRRQLVRAGGAVIASIGIGHFAKASPSMTQDRLPAGQSKARRFSQASLDQALADHAAWLNDPATGRYADFSNADLSGLLMSKVSLEGVDLSGANLSDVIFEEVDLSWARLVGADLRRACLDFCELVGTNFNLARLDRSQIITIRPGEHGTDIARSFERVSFRHANLNSARIVGHLEHTSFDGASLIVADFSGSSFDGCRFVGACLSAANLSETAPFLTTFHFAALKYADLTNAILVDNDLSRANLSGIRLVGALVQRNRLTGAKLRHADLRCAKFQANVDCQALIDHLVGPSRLGCRLDGAIIEGRQFDWSSGPKPRPIWAKA